MALNARVDDVGLGVLEIRRGLSIDAGSSDRLDTSDRDVDDVDDAWDAVEDWRDAGGHDIWEDCHGAGADAEDEGNIAGTMDDR